MGYQSDGFCPWVKREVVFHNLPVFFVFWNFVPRNLTWNLKMMVSKRNLRTSRDFSSASMLNFGGTSFPNLTVLSLPPPPRHKSKDSHRSRRQGSQLGTGSASVKLGIFGGGKMSGPTQQGVSENGGTLKWMVYNGKPYENG